MTGPKDSAIGRDLKSVTAMLLTGIPTRFKLAEDDVKLEGVVIDIESETGLAKRIQRIRMGSES
jgi:calcineurin-like phosphoesterase